MRLGALLMLALPLPATAQDLPPAYPVEALETCLLQKPDVEAEHCIGIAAGDCIYSGQMGSNAGMGACLAAELSQWDARLNDAYQALLSHERADDVAAEGPWPDKAPALQQMQRAWMGYRDATCDYAQSLWGGGTGGPLAATECRLDLTARQAILLGQRLEDTKEGAYIARPSVLWR
ncbi:MAG: hypothetical protein CSA65_05515 [Proteobacteria bacterium]|nr:MAG: hypothetical protein CSA65_05515 [Pseudomonadota bacterium]